MMPRVNWPNLRQRIHRVMNHLATEVLVGALIVTSVALLIVEASLPPDSPRLALVDAANDVITAAFIFELTLRFVAERSARRFFRRFWLDILAVVPLFRGLRLLRILRLLRLFRIGAILNQHLQQASTTFRSVKLEYIFAGLMIIVAVLMGALSMRSVENFESLEDALWFAVMTIAAAEPVGAEPTTRMGRMVTLALMLGGMTAFAFVAGTVSAAMIETLKRLRFKRMDLEELEGHVVVCGWNQAGTVFLDELLHDSPDLDVVIITEKRTIDESSFGRYGGMVHIIHDDFTRIPALKRAQIERAAFAVILADEGDGERSAQDRDARTVLAALLVERMTDKRIHTTVQLLNGENEASLREAGVEDVVVSDTYVGSMMASAVKNRGMMPAIAELLSARNGQQLFKVPPPSALLGMSVANALVVLKDRYDATLIGLEMVDDRGRRVRVNPPADLILSPDHQIIVTAAAPPR